jgi:hypothetical protein
MHRVAAVVVVVAAVMVVVDTDECRLNESNWKDYEREVILNFKPSRQTISAGASS